MYFTAYLTFRTILKNFVSAHFLAIFSRKYYMTLQTELSNICFSNFLNFLFQVCPPTNEYPLVYNGTQPFQCSFPEALKFIEEKCHGQVSSLVSTLYTFILSSCTTLTYPWISDTEFCECAGIGGSTFSYFSIFFQRGQNL
jgi:hypothetical protein